MRVESCISMAPAVRIAFLSVVLQVGMKDFADRHYL